ncbi:hypothetical protein HDU67_001578 [Dinochytrium kinnereticum]|nr:hypothetical protein HDU67_001578 [Dinochytrium kinnereticum]
MEIINKYRQNPYDYLGLGALLDPSRHGKLPKILYLHRLLEARRMINVQVPPSDAFENLDSRFYANKHKVRPYQSLPVNGEDRHRPRSLLQFRDFIKTASGRGLSGHSVEDFWSDRDCAILLRAIEQHGNDWASIAKAVGSFSKEQCLMKFLQLDLANEGSMARTLDSGGNLSNTADRIAMESKLETTFLALSDNPLMSLLAILHHSLSPAVAATCAKNVLKHVTSLHPNAPLSSLGLAELALESAVQQSKLVADELEAFAYTRMQTLTDLQLKKIKIKVATLESESNVVPSVLNL